MTTRLFTPEEVAERLAVTPKAVRAWLRDGKLPGLRLGRLWRVRADALEEFIDGPGFAAAPKRTVKGARRTTPARKKKSRKPTKATRRRTR